VARDDFCESTVGFADKKNGACFQRLLDCPTFRVGSINDVAGVELCGGAQRRIDCGSRLCAPLLC
jgi:glycerol-3-phosphate dehydrogenase (NAD+)